MTILTNDSVRFWDTTFVCINVKYDTKPKNFVKRYYYIVYFNYIIYKYII